jgi:hypothetical protein
MKLRLDDFRVGIRPGQGLVARFPAAILIITAPDWQATPGVDRLIDECRQGAGRPLTERLADLVDVDPAKTPAFCALVDDNDGLAFFVHGDTQVVLTGAQPVMRMSGRGTAGWSGGVRDRVASIAVGPALGSDGDGAPNQYDDVGDLREGVVPGGAVVLVPRDAELSASHDAFASTAFAPPAPAAEADQPANPPGPPPVVVAPPVPKPAPAVLPVAPRSTPASAPVAAVDGPPAMVWGIHCKRGHFNNPDARYCRMCGTHMVHQRRDPVLGPRPVLGFLVVDDGATYKLDADYVIGRDPGGEETVVAGEARGLTLSDPEESVSPAHAAIRLDGWEVFLQDLAPRYGTHVWRPGTAGWVRLDPGQKVMLEPRTHILLGRRTMVFDSVNRR